MGRATSGVTGMKFRGDDELLAMAIASDDLFVFVVTELGYAKRTAIAEYRKQGRGGLGIKVAKLAEARGDLVGALTVSADDEVLVVMQAGRVVRSRVDEVPAKGRDTMGVTFAKPETGDRILAVARNVERVVAAELGAVDDAVDDEASEDAVPVLETTGGAPVEEPADDGAETGTDGVRSSDPSGDVTPDAAAGSPEDPTEPGGGE